MTERLILKFAEWPQQDRTAWSWLFEEGDVFDGSGPCHHWSEGSRRKREQSYGHWLAFLHATDWTNLSDNPSERFQQETVGAFIDFCLARLSRKSTAMQIEDLYVLAAHLDPLRDWTWFKTAKDSLRRQVATGQVKPRPRTSAPEVMLWGLSEMEAADAMPETQGWERSVRFRDGLMVSLLIARPIRRRAFIGMEIGKQLLSDRDGFSLRFSPEDMKNRKAHEFDFPERLVAPMQRYLDVHRPALLQGRQTLKLWVSRRGGALSSAGFERHLYHITERAFGEGYRPHAFRHIAATSIAEADPEHVNITASVLGHASLEMAERYYNRATTISAVADWQRTLAQLRRRARRIK